MDYLINLLNGSYFIKGVSVDIDTERHIIRVDTERFEEPRCYVGENADKEIDYIFQLFACNVFTLGICLEKWLDKEHISWD